MSNINLSWFAKKYGVNSLGGLAQKANLHWPPPPAVSVQSILRVIGLPLSPDASIKIQHIGFQGDDEVLSFSWKDPGAGTPIQATSWQWTLSEQISSILIASGTVQSPSLGPQQLKQGSDFELLVVPSNDFGTGPSDLADFTTAAQGPPPPPPSGSPTITASIDSNDNVTVVGKNFNKSQAVNLQATVKAGPSTPNLAPNNVPDLRNQFASATADANGFFTVTIQPQGFKQAQFMSGVADVLAGETIAVIAKNNNVGSFSPGPGVSNVVNVVAQSTV